MHDDEPAVSPSEVAESPLSFSDIEHDDSSLEDEQPIGTTACDEVERMNVTFRCSVRLLAPHIICRC